MLQLIQPESPQHLDQVRQLLREYADTLDVELCLQRINQAIVELPGEYGPPQGCLLLALYDHQPAGCVALRNIGDRVAEMKRFFVKPAFRGLGIGRALAKSIVEEARALEFSLVRLDTLKYMEAARELYRSLGFYEIGPYGVHPQECSHFMECKLLNTCPPQNS